ncbi:LysR family transcriptional regulator [Saccharibacillus sp. O16]|nr:LysR family transcriptional regulator [Saccharibacillus sp. O16]
MDLKELVTFRTVIEQGTFARAAEKLHYAQSTVTAQIQRLEKELGFRLFERGWEARLTEAGRWYAAEVDGLIAHWTHVRERGLALGREESGLLALGVIEPIAEKGLAQLLGPFHQRKPGIECRVRVDATAGLARALSAGELELAICGRPLDMKGLFFETLYMEEIVFAVAGSHPLAGSHLTLESLYRYPLVAGGEDCLYHLRLEQEFAAYPAKPFTYTINRLAAVPAVARELGGIAVILASTQLPDDMVTVSYDLQDPQIPVGLLQRTEQRYHRPGTVLLTELIRSAHKISASERPN